MKVSLLSVLSLAAVFLSTGASALASKDGVINSLDLESRVVTLNNQKYLVSETTRIVVDGKPATIADLSPSQSVSYKVRTPKKAEKLSSSKLKAKIIGIDSESGMIEVQSKNQDESISFQVLDTTKVSGDGKNIQDLAVGQSVTLKFRSK